MSSAQQRRQILAWILLLSLVILPSLLISPKAAVRSLYPLLILSALLNHRRTMILLMVPILLIMPVALYFWSFYHAPMNASFWLILLGTDVVEVGDFLKNFWLILIPTWIVLLLLVSWIWKSSPGKVFHSKKLRFAAGICILVPIITIGKNFSPENIKVEMAHHFTESYPWNFLMGYVVAKDEIEAYRKTDFSTQWTLHSKVAPDLANKPEVIVLVIGESARRDRHQIYGYQEKTTPEMVKLHDAGELLVFNDFITLHPHTANAVPTIMTKQDNIHEIKEIPPSFVQIYKDAGFKTYWISNQAAMGGNENRISVYARRSDYFHSLHISSINLPWAYDGELLPELYDILAQPEPKKFIVLHLQGSHYGFDKRYPREFAQFKELYDNTILYTDYLLGQIVEHLRATHNISAMMYLSDHGLMLGECGQYTHFDMKQSYEIPFWIWTSPEWRSENGNGKKFANGLKNSSKKLSTLFALDSLVDLGGLTYQQYEPEKSVLEPTLKEIFPRNVKTYSQIVDYDHGKNDKDCHFVNEK
jgi:heptose-I-phosphate ethanolaminephosphotransferase